MRIELKKVDFGVRQSRPEFILDEFPEIFSGSVLDLGSDAGVIKKSLPFAQVTSVDITEKADIHLNLDACASLPFSNQEFETVICLDVLEHLENLHRVFDEAARVCGKWLLVSLPNSWHLARLRIARGRGEIAHYGLPLSPPEDRHRWFFNYEEALAFFRASEGLEFKIVRVLAAEKQAFLPISWFRHLFWPYLTRYRNRYVHTIFCLFVRLDG